MGSSLIDEMVADWQTAQSADTPLRCDAAIEHLLNRLVRHARTDRRHRAALIEPSFGDGIHDPLLAGLLQVACNGVHSWHEGRYPDAAESFEELAQWAKSQLPKKTWTRRSLQLHALAWASACQTRQGKRPKLRRAGTMLKRAEKLFDHADLPHARGWFHNERARLAFWEDDLETAEIEYAAAEQQFIAANNSFALAEVYDARSRLLTHQGLYRGAMEQLTLARRWHDPGDRLGQAKSLFHAARILRYQQNYAEAITTLLVALDRLKHVKDPRWEAHIRDVLGDVYLLSGDLQAAAKQYGARVFQRSDDSLVRLRSKYRITKLELAKIEREPSPRRRARRLEQLILTCDELIDKGDVQLISEKTLLILGRMHLHLDNFGQAAKCFERASRQFNRHHARWYQAEATFLVGEARSRAGKEAAAAQTWFAGLRGAVDAVQKSRLLENLQNHFQLLGPEKVCEYLAELSEETTQLRETVIARQQAETQVSQVVQNLNFVQSFSCFAHSLRDLPTLSVPDCQAKIVDDLMRCAKLGDKIARQQRQLLRTQRPAGTFRWFSVAELLESLGPKHITASRLKRVKKSPSAGILGDVDALQTSLLTLVAFMESWTGEVKCSLQSGTASAAMTLSIIGRRTPVEHGLLSMLLDVRDEPPPLERCELSAGQWASLMSATFQIRTVRGEVALEPQGRGSKTSQTYRLVVRLPIEPIPLGVLPD